MDPIKEYQERRLAEVQARVDKRREDMDESQVDSSDVRMAYEKTLDGIYREATKELWGFWRSNDERKYYGHSRPSETNSFLKVRDKLIIAMQDFIDAGGHPKGIQDAINEICPERNPSRRDPLRF